MPSPGIRRENERVNPPNTAVGTNRDVELSFVIPAFNEVRSLPAVLASIHRSLDSRTEFEIIVVDHGSNDGTGEVAAALGARVLSMRGGTIGGARNLGARQAAGDLLVFLDADVTLEAGWYEELCRIRGRLDHRTMFVLGSRCEVPQNAPWVARTWARVSAVEGPVAHLGSGHMVTTRAAFHLIGGFDERLTTGEDQDFTDRAKTIGAAIISAPTLRAVHHGSPSSVLEFVRRESWHGVGDWKGIRRFLRSKVAVSSLVFVVLHLVWGLWILTHPDRLAVSLLYLVPVVAGCFVLAIRRGPSYGLLALTRRAFLCYLYLWARAGSGVRLMFRPRGDRGWRSRIHVQRVPPQDERRDG